MRADGRGLRRQPEVEGEMGSGSGSGAVHSPGRLTTTTTTTRNPSRDGTTRQRRRQQQQQNSRIDSALPPPRGFSPCLRHNSCRLSIFRCLGEAIRSVCLSQRDVKLAPPIPKYRSLFGRRRRRIQAIGTRLKTSVQVRPRTPIGDLSVRVWVEEGGAGSGDMMASGRPAIRDIFPCAPVRRRPCGVC